MFRPTDPQLSLMEAQFLVNPAKRARLRNSWAEAFRKHVLPYIKEEMFRPCFAENDGRPNKSIRLLVGMHLLKEANDLTDEQILAELEFNLQWQHALGVEPSTAHLCEKTLHNFRANLVENGRAQEMFQQLTEALMKADGLSAVRQRLDSTHVISNIAVLTRLRLFVETVASFLRQLRKSEPDKLAKLNSGYAKRYLDREGYFSDAKREQAQRRLPAVAQDLYALVRRFDADETVRAWPSYELLVRLLADQCDVVGEEEAKTSNVPVKPKEPKTISAASLQSPHDPDATYGHKGKGYEAHLAETCVESNPYQVVTAIEVNGAHVSDQTVTVPIVEGLVARGIAPEALLADTNYGSGENIAACADMGVSLLAPVHGPTAPAHPDSDGWEQPIEAVTPVTAPPAAEEIGPAEGAAAAAEEPRPAEGAAATAEEPRPAEGAAATEDGSAERPTVAEPSAMAPPVSEVQGAPRLDLGAFRFSGTWREVLTCPAGNSPLSNDIGETTYRATFDGSQCAGCALLDRCPTRRIADGDRVLAWRDTKAATATRQREQQEPAFKEAYKLRSGIESTNAELKGRHGAGDLRVRGGKRVAVSLVLKALALNAKRAVQHHTEVLRGVLAQAAA